MFQCTVCWDNPIEIAAITALPKRSTDGVGKGSESNGPIHAHETLRLPNLDTIRMTVSGRESRGLLIPAVEAASRPRTKLETVTPIEASTSELMYL